MTCDALVKPFFQNEITGSIQTVNERFAHRPRMRMNHIIVNAVTPSVQIKVEACASFLLKIFPCLIVNSDHGHTHNAAHTFLCCGYSNVNTPGIHFKVYTGKCGNCIDNQRNVKSITNRSNFFDWVQNAVLAFAVNGTNRSNVFHSLFQTSLQYSRINRFCSGK